jgi:hypothetical protein
MPPHYEEDIILLTGATSGNYTTGGINVVVTKSVQIQLFDHATIKAVSSAANTSYSSVIVPQIAEVQGSESGQAFRLRVYQPQYAFSGGEFALISGYNGEIAPGSTVPQGLPIHVSYEGT